MPPQPDPHLGALPLDQARALLEAHASAALRLEHTAALAVARFIRATASDLFRWLTQLWVSRFGALTTRIDPLASSALAVDVTRRLRTIPAPDPAPLLTRQAQQALDLGLKQGAVELGVTRPVVSEVTPSTTRLIGEVSAKVQQRWSDTERLLATHPIGSHADAVTVLAPTQAAAGDVDTASRWITNHGVNQGLADTAREHDADLLWFAEANACVVCLALSGEVVHHDESFDADATFGRKPVDWWQPPDEHGPLRPPRHRRCRCRTEVYLGHDHARGGATTLPMALKREARRSIALGWALESEPDSVRRDAADRLLKSGAGLPKSVMARARHRVDAAGKFKRSVPTGDG